MRESQSVRRIGDFIQTLGYMRGVEVMHLSAYRVYGETVGVLRAKGPVPYRVFSGRDQTLCSRKVCNTNR